MSRGQTQSHSAAALRRYEGRLHRARKDFDDAQRAQAAAKIELDAAERAHEAAKHVFQASEADRTRDLGLDKVAPVTMSWIRALLSYPHAGSAELAEAAAAVGWQADHDAIRQQASRFAKTGVLERVGRGVYRVADRARNLLETAPPTADQAGKQPQAAVIREAPQHVIATRTDIENDDPNVSEDRLAHQGDAQDGPDAQYEGGADDEYDDDVPF